MALVNIAWYSDAGVVTGNAIVQAPKITPERWQAEQVDTTSDGTSSASPFWARLVKITPHAAVYMVPLDATGTADAQDEYLPANVPQFFYLGEHDGSILFEFTAV